jgi:hypothetical protein
MAGARTGQRSACRQFGGGFTVGKQKSVIFAHTAGGDRGIGGEELRERLGFVVAGDKPQDPARAVNDWIDEGHSASALVRFGQGDINIRDIEDGISGNKRSRVAIGSEAEVN